MEGKVIYQIVNNMRLTDKSIVLNTVDQRLYRYVSTTDNYSITLQELNTDRISVVSVADIELVKLFVKTRAHTYELKYSDYDKVKIGDTVTIKDFVYKTVKPKINNEVYVTGIPISFLKQKYKDEIDLSKIQKGVIIGMIQNKYKVDIGNHILVLRRNNFQLANRNNFKKVACVQ